MRKNRLRKLTDNLITSGGVSDEEREVLTGYVKGPLEEIKVPSSLGWMQKMMRYNGFSDKGIHTRTEYVGPSELKEGVLDTLSMIRIRNHNAKDASEEIGWKTMIRACKKTIKASWKLQNYVLNPRLTH